MVAFTHNRAYTPKTGHNYAFNNNEQVATMNNDGKWLYISGCLIEMQRQDDVMQKMLSAIGGDPEMKIAQPFYTMMAAQVISLELITGDAGSRIFHYVNVLDYGRDDEGNFCDVINGTIDSVDKLRLQVEADNG